jgi:membrane associated rhomboid family serine protease
MDLAALIYQRDAFWGGQWWLPLSAQLAHFNLAHALSNGAAAVVLALVLRPFVSGMQQVTLALSGACAVALVVVLDSACSYYAGASGALYGWAAGGCLLGLLKKPPLAPANRKVAMLVLALLGVRLVAMQWSGVQATAWGFPVYLPAHWTGAFGGLLAAGVLARRAAARPSLESKA